MKILIKEYDHKDTTKKLITDAVDNYDAIAIYTGEDIPPDNYEYAYFVLSDYFEWLRGEYKYRNNEDAVRFREELQRFCDKWDVNPYDV